jgi:hypothetical protein
MDGEERKSREQRMGGKRFIIAAGNSKCRQRGKLSIFGGESLAKQERGEHNEPNGESAHRLKRRLVVSPPWQPRIW